MTSLGAGWALLAVGAATGLATALGGLGALRLRSAMGLLMGFGAGAVTGVALFDLLPEALEISRGALAAETLMAALACGFAGYLAFDRFALRLEGQGAARGHARAALLTWHSLIDGLGIGLAFQVSSAAGAIVAVGVLAHDFLDGANTVVVSLSGGTGRRAARRWLAADAAAPLAGMLLSSQVAVPRTALAVGLAVFAGLFLNIGACELLPQSQALRPLPSTTLATFAGMALIWVAVRFAG